MFFFYFLHFLPFVKVFWGGPPDPPYMSSCRNITDVGFQAVCDLPLLKKLHMSHCDGITDHGLSGVKNLKNIKSLNTNYCSNSSSSWSLNMVLWWLRAALYCFKAQFYHCCYFEVRIWRTSLYHWSPWEFQTSFTHLAAWSYHDNS